MRTSAARPAVRLAVLLALAVAGSGAAARAAEFPFAHGAHHPTTRPAGTVPAAERSPVRAYLETDLFFGAARPDGRPPVTDHEFRRFVDAELTPRFPDGLIVQQGDGQYRDSHDSSSGNGRTR